MHPPATRPNTLLFFAIAFVELSAAYRYETSLSALLRIIFLPSAAFTPFAAAGVNRSVTKLSGGLRYTSFAAFATIGLQARVARRWFLGAELAVLYALGDAAKVGTSRSSISPADRFDVLPGTFVGVYFP